MEKLLSLEKGSFFYYIAVLVITLIVILILLHSNKMLFKKLKERKVHLHLVFFEKIINIVIVVICLIVGVSFFGGVDSVWQSLLGGTAVISAVVIFVAQDTIKDILAGLMISIYHPFEIGDRITLENGQSGIVKDITMRHVVIHTWGSQELIIPNSKINTMSIINDSYQANIRSYQASFRIAYDSDVTKAMEIIKQVIIDSKYTIEGKVTNHGLEYDDVYFMAYEDSSLLLSTTVFYRATPTEVVRSDINLKINQAFKENNIEIPYQYINIVKK